MAKKHHPPVAGFFYHTVIWCLCVLYRAFFRFTMVGRANLPRTGPVMLLPNHASYFDPLMIALMTHRPLRFAAKEELFRGLGGWVFPRLSSIAVRRGTADRAVFREADAVFERGDIFCLFPEGTRTATGEIGPFQPGALAMALKADVRVVPIAVCGTFEALPRHGGLRRASIGLEAGVPLRFIVPKASGPRAKRIVEACGLVVQEELRRLQRRIRQRQEREPHRGLLG